MQANFRHAIHEFEHVYAVVVLSMLSLLWSKSSQSHSELSISCLVDLCESRPIRDSYMTLTYGLLGRLLLIPIIVTTQNSEKLGETIPSITGRLPEQAVCHDKSLFSMLEEPVMEEIKRINPDHIVIVGIETQICISQTALGKTYLSLKLITLLTLEAALRSKDYQVTVLADAVSSSSAWEKSLALQRLRSNGVDVNSLESWLFESTVGSTHPRFRELSSTIKKYKKAKRNGPRSAL